MPKLTITSPEVMKKLLETKNSAKVELSPEEKLAQIFAKASKNGIRIKRFHFNLIESGTTLILFNGSKNKIDEFPKTIKGIKDARVCARKLFLNSPTIYRQGGFKFDMPFSDDSGAIKNEFDKAFGTHQNFSHDREVSRQFIQEKVKLLDLVATNGIEGKDFLIPFEWNKKFRDRFILGSRFSSAVKEAALKYYPKEETKDFTGKTLLRKLREQNAV